MRRLVQRLPNHQPNIESMKYLITTSTLFFCFFAMGLLAAYIPKGMNPLWAIVWVIPSVLGLLAGFCCVFWAEGGQFFR